MYLRVDEGECLLWGMNSDVEKTVGDNRGRETEKTKTKNVIVISKSFVLISTALTSIYH